MRTVIITGTTRGIGEAMARLLLEQGHRVIGVARGNSESLQSYGRYDGVAADLSRLEALEGLMAEIFARVQPQRSSDGIYLVNNAAMLQPLRNAEQLDAAAVASHMSVNLTAPIMLSALFAQHAETWHGDRRILNLSSGSADNPLPGMGCYCAAKAGLDMFTKVMGLEQLKKPAPIRVASVWPGMIETEMQAEARRQPRESFESAGLFIGAQESGMLARPEHTASRLVELLFSDAFPQGGVVEDLETFPPAAGPRAVR
jgi:benzil reductase ((S)-benzoin forming)